MRMLEAQADRFEVCYEASCGYGHYHDPLCTIAAQVTVAHPERSRLMDVGPKRGTHLLCVFPLSELRMTEKRSNFLRSENNAGECKIAAKFALFHHINTVRDDSTNFGGFPIEYTTGYSGCLPRRDRVKFTPDSMNETYELLEMASFRDAGEPQRFSFLTSDALTTELKDQTLNLVRDYNTDRHVVLPPTPGESRVPMSTLRSCWRSTR
jgi:hypothetical protein